MPYPIQFHQIIFLQCFSLHLDYFVFLVIQSISLFFSVYLAYFILSLIEFVIIFFSLDFVFV